MFNSKSQVELSLDFSLTLICSEGEGRAQTEAAHDWPESDGGAHPADAGQEAQPRIAETLHLRGWSQHRGRHSK